MYRQGDVMLVPTEKKEVDGLKKADRMILAHGEVTGHVHEVQGANADLFEREGVPVLLEVREKSELTHQEHSTILIEPGFYEVVRQREYTPEGELWVAD